MASKQHQRLGDGVWARMPRVNAEIFTLTYGALVMQLIKDYEDVEAVNTQLEKMGHNIGVRLVDEFLSKTNVTACTNFRETADVVSKVALKMFLGMNCEVANWNAENTAFSLMLPTGSASSSSSSSGSGVAGYNPLTEFVELPPQYADLQYSNLLCGVIRGALEMLQLNVGCRWVRDVLRGDDANELRVELRGALETVMADEYKEN